ncbi:MAG: hypothetical protein AB8B91_00145 [Rubripirellula sp.]
MRTLTLGVLIVAGGTLAALPFRRYQAIPDASAEPVHVTGPEHSALTVPPSQLAESSADPVSEETLASLQAQVLSIEVPRFQRQSVSIAPESPRSIDVPLTFEDLMDPIDQPSPIKQRYSATTPIRAEAIERERVAGLVMPEMESLAASQVEAFNRSLVESKPQRLGTSQAEGAPVQNTPRASASLASSREETIQRLPQAQTPPETRVRHWIRQPN